jgi:hypothetical protein
MPHGGPRKGAGRKRDLSLAQREEIRREYRQRMQAWAAAQQMRHDSTRRKRIAILEEVAQLAKKHPPLSFLQHERREDELNFYGGARRLFKPLEDKLNRLSDQPSVAFPLKRAKGPRKRFIKELAEKFGVKQRMVIRCIDET